MYIDDYFSLVSVVRSDFRGEVCPLCRLKEVKGKWTLPRRSIPRQRQHENIEHVMRTCSPS